MYITIRVIILCFQLFEGMKGYKCVDGKVRLFRPDQNMERMRKTAHRCTLPVSLCLTSADGSVGKVFICQDSGHGFQSQQPHLCRQRYVGN